MKNTVFEEYCDPRLDRDVQMRRMRSVIRRELSPRQRRVLEGIYYENRTQTSLARELGVNKSTVCRTLRRAEDRLRRYLRY